MSDLKIPEKLPKGSHDYFLNDFFTAGKTEKNIICYYHDSSLEYPIKIILLQELRLLRQYLH